MYTPHFEPGSGACALALALTIVGVASPARADGPPCPGTDAQSIPFDGTNVLFDSLLSKSAQGGAKVTYCLKIENYKHDYAVDWEGTDLRDLITRNGALSSERAIDGDDPGYIDQSTAYLGVNRKDVHPGIYKEKTVLVALKQALVTYLSGAVSTAARGRPDREARSVPAELTFKAQQKDPGYASLEFSNSAPQAQEIRFTFPEAVRQKYKELDGQFSIGHEPKSVSYDLGPGERSGQRVQITFQNSDNQEVGSMPIDIIGSRPER
jgi:hypothetical protein